MKQIKISIIGLPNSGKSTLMNYLLKEKIAIVSPMAHTTKESVWGIIPIENGEIIFIDTPGITNSNKKEKKILQIITVLKKKWD